MAMKKKPVIKKRLTQLQKRTLKELTGIDGKVSIAEAMRRAGYSAEMVNNPQKFTRSKGYVSILEAAGETDELLAKKQKILLNSEVIEHMSFPSIMKETTITHSKKGRKLKQPETLRERIAVPDDEIFEIIESVSGHKVLYIQNAGAEKVVYYKAPNSVVQTKQIEIGLKVKGHFAPLVHDIMTHELSDEERKLLEGIIDLD